MCTKVYFTPKQTPSLKPFTLHCIFILPLTSLASTHSTEIFSSWILLDWTLCFAPTRILWNFFTSLAWIKPSSWVGPSPSLFLPLPFLFFSLPLFSFPCGPHDSDTVQVAWEMDHLHWSTWFILLLSWRLKKVLFVLCCPQTDKYWYGVCRKSPNPNDSYEIYTSTAFNDSLHFTSNGSCKGENLNQYAILFLPY